MAADAARLQYLAERGHFGHAALLDPTSFVQSVQPTVPGIQVAQNVNEFGIGDQKIRGIPREAGPTFNAGSDNPESDKLRQQALYERLVQGGANPAEAASLTTNQE